MEPELSNAASLALALSGFGASQAFRLGGGQTHARAALRKAPCVSAAPLVAHLKEVVAAVVEDLEEPDHAGGGVDSPADKIKSLCFAISSTVGAGELEPEEQADLWTLSTALWEASLKRCGGDAGGGADSLHDLGSEVFQLIDGERDEARDVSHHIAFLCKAGRAWEQLGRAERAAWCVGRAVRCADRLEGLMASGELEQGRRERCVLQLFALYLEAAKTSAHSRQQSVANNLLARAVQLGRNEAVGPAAAATMCVALSEHQASQAREMLRRGEAAMAGALLTASRAQLESAAAAASAAGADRASTAALSGALARALLLEGEARLAAGEAPAAVECLEQILLSGAACREVQLPAFLLLLGAKLAAGQAAGAVQLLHEMVQDTASAAAAAAADGTPASGEEEERRMDAAVTFWLGALQTALPLLPAAAAPALSIAVQAFLGVTAGCPDRVLRLVEVLLDVEPSPDGNEDGDRGAAWQRHLALQLLATDGVAATLFGDASAQGRCHSLLHLAAARRYSDHDFAAAAALFSASFHYAPAATRAKTAILLAACHQRMGQPQRALEYLDVAKKAEPRPAVLGQLLRLHASLDLHNVDMAVAAVRGMEGCADFDPSHISTACAVAAAAGHAVVRREAVALAVRVHIPHDGGSSASEATGAEVGQEARLLLALCAATLECADEDDAAGPDNASSGLFDQLVAAMRLATRRLKALGAQRFAGGFQPSPLLALAAAGHAACVRALAAGAYEQSVTLATSTCVLLEAAGPAAAGEEEEGGGSRALRQGSVLLVAVQALLELPAATGPPTNGGSKLALAGKLLQKAKREVDKASGGPRADRARAALGLLALETAARHGTASAALEALAALAAGAPSALGAAQLEAVVRSSRKCSDAAAHRAAAALLLQRWGGEGQLAAPMLVLPAVLGQLDAAPEQQVALCQAGAAALQRTPEAPSLLPSWLAHTAFHLAGAAAASPAVARALMAVAKGCSGADAGAPAMHQLRRGIEAVSAAIDEGWLQPQNPVAEAAGEEEQVGMEVEVELEAAPAPEAAIQEGDAEAVVLQAAEAAERSAAEEELTGAPSAAATAADVGPEEKRQRGSEGTALHSPSPSPPPPPPSASARASPSPPKPPADPTPAAGGPQPAEAPKRASRSPHPTPAPAKRPCVAPSAPPRALRSVGGEGLAGSAVAPAAPSQAVRSLRLRPPAASKAAGAAAADHQGGGGSGGSAWLDAMYSAQRKADADRGVPRRKFVPPRTGLPAPPPAAPLGTASAAAAAAEPGPREALDTAEMLSIDSVTE